MLIGSIKTGTSSLWGLLVDKTNGSVVSGGLTHKGDISRKEKDFFGDPSMWRMGRAWYERVWPRCPLRPTVAIDATPAYHVWHDAPKNMRTFFGPLLPALRLVWVLRDPVSKFWSYFWELKSYGGDWDRVSFSQFATPKLARARTCLQRDPSSPLWPPSMPPPFDNCAPHLDHGLYYPQLQRWLQFFAPSQLLLVSFSGYTAQPAAVLRDVLIHGRLSLDVATRASAAAAARPTKKTKYNSRARGRGHMPRRLWNEVHALYQPFVDRLYRLIRDTKIAVSPCGALGTRFLDPPNTTLAASPARAGPDD